MASIVITDMVRHQRSHYGHLSMPAFCVLLHLAENVREYKNEWTPGAKGDPTATKLSEIDPTRWSTWETQETVLTELPMSRSQLNAHLSTLRMWGDIATGTKVVTGEMRTEHTITNRTAENDVLAEVADRAEAALAGRTLTPIRLVGATPTVVRSAAEPGTSEANDPVCRYRVDEVVDPKTPAGAVDALIRKVQAAFEGDWLGEPQPLWMPSPAGTADLLERAVALYVQHTKPAPEPIVDAQVIVFPATEPNSDDDVVDAEIVEDEPTNAAEARERLRRLQRGAA